MYQICNPVKIQLYVNVSYVDMLTIQARLGCDILINGGLFEMKSFSPNCWLRVDNRTLHTETWQDWGYAWNTGSDIKLEGSFNINLARNFISCVTLIKEGAKQPLSYPRELGGKRGRTAIGLRADHQMIIWCAKDGSSDAMTPEQLQQKMLDLGAESAIMLDGGASSQCIMPNGTITSASRPRVHNYIAIWIDRSQEKPVEVQCPYAEPTYNIKQGSRGTGARWVQWHLNQCGSNLTVDGVFGALSTAALRAYQKANGLYVDGICGVKTRSSLKSKVASIVLAPDDASAETNHAVSCPYVEPITAVKYWQTGNAVRWAQWHLQQCGYNIKIDGSYGPAMLTIVKSFQRAANIKVDGMIGAQTRSALKSFIGKDIGGNNEYRQMLIDKREQMLDYIEKRVGDIYVYGSQGEDAGDAVINWSAHCFPSSTTAQRAARMKKYVKEHPLNACGEPIKAHDCSGLFWAAENIVELPLVDGKDIDDATAEGLYRSYCTPIQKDELQPLDLVFNSTLTHVGIVGRGGKIYEAAGSDIGVVVNDNVDDRTVPSIYGTKYGLSTSYSKAAWTKFGRLKIYANEGL